MIILSCGGFNNGSVMLHEELLSGWDYTKRKIKKGTRVKNITIYNKKNRKKIKIK